MVDRPRFLSKQGAAMVWESVKGLALEGAGLALPWQGTSYHFLQVSSAVADRVILFEMGKTQSYLSGDH